MIFFWPVTVTSNSRGRRSSSEGPGPKLWPIGSCDVVSLHFLRIGTCLEELELEKKAAACLVLSKFVPTWETCSSINFVEDFVWTQRWSGKKLPKEWLTKNDSTELSETKMKKHIEISLAGIKHVETWLVHKKEKHMDTKNKGSTNSDLLFFCYHTHLCICV